MELDAKHIELLDKYLLENFIEISSVCDELYHHSPCVDIILKTKKIRASSLRRLLDNGNDNREFLYGVSVIEVVFQMMVRQDSFDKNEKGLLSKLATAFHDDLRVHDNNIFVLSTTYEQNNEYLNERYGREKVRFKQEEFITSLKNPNNYYRAYGDNKFSSIVRKILSKFGRKCCDPVRSKHGYGKVVIASDQVIYDEDVFRSAIENDIKLFLKIFGNCKFEKHQINNDYMGKVTDYLFIKLIFYCAFFKRPCFGEHQYENELEYRYLIFLKDNAVKGLYKNLYLEIDIDEEVLSI